MVGTDISTENTIGKSCLWDINIPLVNVKLIETINSECKIELSVIIFALCRSKCDVN